MIILIISEIDMNDEKRGLVMEEKEERKHLIVELGRSNLKIEALEKQNCRTQCLTRRFESIFFFIL